MSDLTWRQQLINPGTPIPPALVMWREGVSRFSLQPSEPTEVESEYYGEYTAMLRWINIFTELNELLSEFYENSATIVGAEEWIEKHPYRESFPDQNEEDWMKA